VAGMKEPRMTTQNRESRTQRKQQLTDDQSRVRWYVPC